MEKWIIHNEKQNKLCPQLSNWCIKYIYVYKIYKNKYDLISPWNRKIFDIFHKSILSIADVVLLENISIWI